MFPRSDLLSDSSDAFLMSDFGILTDFSDLSKDMFVSNAMVSSTADGDLLEGLDCKDDMKPFFSSEVDDAFELPLRGTDDNETFELPLKVSDGDDNEDDIMDSTKIQTSIPLSLLLHEKSSEPLPEFMALTPLQTCSDGLDLAPLYGLASPPLVHGGASSPSPVGRSESTPLSPPSPLVNEISSRRGSKSLFSIDTIGSSIMQSSSPLPSPSSRSTVSTSGGGLMFNTFYDESLRKDLSPRVDDFASIGGNMENLHAGHGQAYHIPCIQRSQSSHALGQFRTSGRIGCGEDGFSGSPVCEPEKTLCTSNPNGGHWAPCGPQGSNATPSVMPMRRVFSTGDLQDLNGIQSLYRGNMESANRRGLMRGKVNHCTSKERQMKLHRYRQKRTERNFNKKIQYACRKTLADSRPRVRGRFARSDETGTDDLPLIDEHEEVSNLTPRIIPEAAYSVRNNTIILASNLIPQYWNAVGRKVAI